MKRWMPNAQFIGHTEDGASVWLITIDGITYVEVDWYF